MSTVSKFTPNIWWSMFTRKLSKTSMQLVRWIIVANSTCSIKWVTSVFEFIHCLFDWAVMCEEAAELTSMTSRIVHQNKKKRRTNKKIETKKPRNALHRCVLFRSNRYCNQIVGFFFFIERSHSDVTVVMMAFCNEKTVCLFALPNHS